MKYPLISEYVESIMCAEDNFATLTNLRPALDDNGHPIMSSGNFAVVFKMEDITNKRLYAIKCFIKEQKGRDEAYRRICEDLRNVDSEHLVHFIFLEKELFVHLSDGTGIEVPVLEMDWVDGSPLDKFIENNIEDSFKLKYLAYQFSDFSQWLLNQPFAHGDLKPDNLLVKKDCSIVMIDYDGMFVPSLGYNASNQIGSPAYQHPARTAEYYAKGMDDFSLLILLIEILASVNNKEIRLPLFSASNYGSLLANSQIKQVFPSSNAALNTAICTLLNDLIDNSITIPLCTFEDIWKRVRSNYYKSSDIEKLTSGYLIRKRTRKGNPANYPVSPIDISLYCDYPSKIKDGTLFCAKDTCGYEYMGDSYDDNWEIMAIPEDVISVSSNAFERCSRVEYLILSNSVRNIGDNAFTGCFNLKYIVFPKEIEKIGNHIIDLWEGNYVGEPDYITWAKSLNNGICPFKNIIVPDGRKGYYVNLIPEYEKYIIDFTEFKNSESTENNPLLLAIADKIDTAR